MKLPIILGLLVFAAVVAFSEQDVASSEKVSPEKEVASFQEIELLTPLNKRKHLKKHEEIIPGSEAASLGELIEGKGSRGKRVELGELIEGKSSSGKGKRGKGKYGKGKGGKGKRVELGELIEGKSSSGKGKRGKG